MTTIAFTQAPAMSTSRSHVRAASDVAKKRIAAATTVMSASVLRSRFLDVDVVIAAHPQTPIARTYSGLQARLHVRRREVAQNTNSAARTIASPRKTNSFGRRKRSAPPVTIV